MKTLKPQRVTVGNVTVKIYARLNNIGGKDYQNFEVADYTSGVRRLRSFSDNAEAIAEAVQRPNMRFVPIKTDDQLDLQALHRVRDRLVSRRTSVINQMRAFLLERGITFRQGRAY